MAVARDWSVVLDLLVNPWHSILQRISKSSAGKGGRKEANIRCKMKETIENKRWVKGKDASRDHEYFFQFEDTRNFSEDDASWETLGTPKRFQRKKPRCSKQWNYHAYLLLNYDVHKQARGFPAVRVAGPH
uniref:Uncharacterized protein n=1 Tax=Magallana gigas TaxID=29159 RepID=K1QMB2_MAGGI